MTKQSRERIIFIDLMRALAVLLMVQGHTIDTFLADEYRTYDSFLYGAWVTIRGFTAPIFMFSSGVAFTYLFKSVGQPFNQNPRVIKGINRFVVLLLTGYLLRFPTYRMVDFSQVTHEQWLTFFTIDALHLIGLGILFVLLFSYLTEKYKLNYYWVYSIAAISFFLLWNVTEKINWANFLPIPFAAYFYAGTGSLFPIFPWTGYVLCGAILGTYLAKNPGIFSTKKFAGKMALIGITFLAGAGLMVLIQSIFFGYKYIVTDNAFVILMRLGCIVLLNSLMAYVSISLKRIPELVKHVGRYTLLIYAVHTIILYGSAWIPGFGMFWAKTLNLGWSIICAIALVAIMILMVYYIEKYKPIWKKKFTTVEA